MAIANPRIHIICGICGNKDMMTYEVKKEINDDTDEPFNQVYITCKNCGSLTGLDEILDEEN